MKFKKILSILIALSFFVNLSFAFDPYADEEVEKKSYKKLYYGIVLTLLGGFLAYDGFSTEEVDVSKPKVDYATVLQSEWSQNEGGEHDYALRSGYSPYDYTPEGFDNPISIEENILYNNGNVDLKNITIEVRYKNNSGYIVDEHPDVHPGNGRETSDGYHVAVNNVTGTQVFENISLAKGESIKWEDLWEYRTEETSPPVGSQRDVDETKSNPQGLYLGEDALTLMDIRIKLNKNQQYKPIYETRHKSDIEGVAGILVGITGIYFIVDHFFDMHKFNTYAKRHHLNLKVTTASNEYKLMLQKRI